MLRSQCSRLCCLGLKRIQNSNSTLVASSGAPHLALCEHLRFATLTGNSPASIGRADASRSSRKPMPTRSTAFAENAPPLSQPSLSSARSGMALNGVRDSSTPRNSMSDSHGADVPAETMKWNSLRAYSDEGHEARKAFVVLVDRLVWASASEKMGAEAASHSGDEHASAATNIFAMPPPTLKELMECFTLASSEMRDVIGRESSTVAAEELSCGDPLALQTACATFVNDLEIRETIVAFVEACARVLQCDKLHRLVEKAADEDEGVADGATATDGASSVTFIPTLRTTAIKAATKLLPHAAEAHDSCDEAIALLSCASSILTLAPSMTDRVAIQKLLVPAIIVCRRLVGPDLATLLLCLSRTFDAHPTSPAGVDGASFLSYTTLTDLKALEMEVFRRFDATFAKYTAPSKLLTADQREAHRRQFIAARQRALLTLTDVSEIATAFAIHRFAGSADVQYDTANSAMLSAAQRDSVLKSVDDNTSGPNTKRPSHHSANRSQLWSRIVKYTMDFITHDLRLSDEMRAAADAVAMETQHEDAYDEGGPASEAENSNNNQTPPHTQSDDDSIDTTFTKADIQGICFALDRVGCNDGYDKLMAFLVDKGILRAPIHPPSMVASAHR